MNLEPFHFRAAIAGADRRRMLLAFTLVELLVTIAIVAILSALLLPAISVGMVRAKNVQCLSQLRQLGMTMTVYASDNKDLLPAAHSIVPWSSTNPVAWTKALFPQENAPKILTCPSYSRFNYQSQFSYFMGSHAAFVEAGAQPAPLALRRVLLPSQYILSGDCNFPFAAQDADPDNYTTDTLFDLVPVGHGHQVNVLFLDLHAVSAKHFETNSMTFSLTLPGQPWQ